jgi:DNA polymerase-3 subunit epsilon
MAWFSRLFAGQEAPDPALTDRQQQLLANWRHLPPPDMRRSHYRCRYVVVDVETTGIDVKTDRLCSIGALAVVDGQIDFKDAFQLLLAEAAPNAEPAPPVDALLAFLDFAGKGPMLAYNVPFVAAMIERVLAEGLHVAAELPWIDLAWVMPDLFRNIDPAQGGLDAWLNHFGIASIRRHDAVSDAYVTAQLLQITIASGARKGFATPASLLELEKARRHMHQSG